MDEIRITPYHKNAARSPLKARKYYFYDNAMVQGEQGVVLENLVACALLKDMHRAMRAWPWAEIRTQNYYWEWTARGQPGNFFPSPGSSRLQVASPPSQP
jgi:predicted AAA+ superfamily ATPase